MNEDIENLKSDLKNILNQDEEVLSEEELIVKELSVDKREEILSIQDPSLIGLEEYAVFLNYAIANIFKILRTQVKTKIPDSVTIKEMGKEAISLAIYTYDIDKAIESKAAFRTHLGWKAKQVVTDYARALKKASKNELNTEDEAFKKHLEDNVLTADAQGNETLEQDIDMPEYQETEKQKIEQMKKYEWGLRQVRYDLPRESNLILDVGIGEIKKENDSAFSLVEWAQFTGQKESVVRKIFSSAKMLLKRSFFAEDLWIYFLMKKRHLKTL